MSALRNRFLASTFLGVLGFSFIVTADSAFAGFEWTPPEKQVTTPLPKASSERNFSEDSSALPEVEDVEVIQESVPVVRENVPPPSSDGRLKVKVITPREESDVAAEAENIEQEPAEPVVMSAPIVPVSEPSDSAPEPFPLTETHQGTDTVMPEPAESVSVPAKGTPQGLNINPYPLEEADHTAPALTEAPAEPEEIAWKSGDFEVVEGFGSDMPLALALRQVVPAQYAFSFGRGVNPGYLVSWEGGKAWNLVLGDMLKPLNIKALIDGNVVKVVSTAPVEPSPASESVPAAGDSSALAPAPEAIPAAPDAEPMKKAEAMSQEEAEKPLKEAIASEEKAKPVEKSVAETPVKVASAPTPAPEPQVRKAPGRNVILDPGDVKPPVADHAEKAAKSDDEDVEEVVLAKAEESAPPSEEVLKSTQAEEAEKPAPSSRSNEQMFQPRIWEAKQGSSLKETLDSWSKQANVPLQWNAEKDYTLSSNILISGTFDNAVKVLFAQAVKNGPAHNLTTGPDAALVIDEAASG